MTSILGAIGSFIWGGADRHPDWPKFRDKFLVGKSCAACGTKKKLEAHHVLPIMWGGPELSEDNLIPLCRRCHLLIGHLGSWYSYNPTVRQDAQFWLDKIRHRPSKHIQGIPDSED